MHCFLHIGTEKTATTTLQAFFHHRRAELADQGVLYTRAAGETNNWRLALAAYDDDRNDDRSGEAGVEGPASRERFRRQLTDELGAETEAARAAGLGSVLFSSEHLHSRLRRPEELERLARVLSALGVTETTVIVYLREQASLAASLHSTLVKHGARSLHPPPPSDVYFRHVCDHRATVERFESVFGSGNVVPRLFESAALVNGSIIEDLLHVVGVEVDAAVVERGDGDGDLNRSLSASELEVLSRVNEQLPYAIDGALNPARVGLVRRLEGWSVGPGYRLPAGRAARYREAFAASNDWVRQRFFPERENLFAAAQTDDDKATSAYRDFDGIASLIVDLWTELQRSKGVEADTTASDTVRTVLASGLFDPHFYLEQNRGVARNGINPLGHYLRHGGREGRAASPDFDSAQYLAQHPDVAASGENPLVHYLKSLGKLD